MELFTTADGWQFLFRWIHFLAGIAWIGMLYYFNFVQTPFFATELGGQARSQVVRGLLPKALWWFRWGAMATLVTGLLLAWMNGYIVDAIALGLTDGVANYVSGSGSTVLSFNYRVASTT